MSGRWVYLNRALTGRFDPVMLQVKKEWDVRTGENSFGRLDSFRYALTHWSISFKNGHIFLFPYGRNIFHISKKLIHISNPLFSIYFYLKTDSRKGLP